MRRIKIDDPLRALIHEQAGRDGDCPTARAVRREVAYALLLRLDRSVRNGSCQVG